MLWLLQEGKLVDIKDFKILEKLQELITDTLFSLSPLVPPSISIVWPVTRDKLGNYQEVKIDSVFLKIWHMNKIKHTKCNV